MHHVHRYAQGTGRDVRTPKELWAALQSEGEIVNSTAERVRVSRVGPHILPWRNSMTTKHRTMVRLWLVAEVVYSRDGAENLSASLYGYSDGKIGVLPLWFQYIGTVCYACGGSGDRVRKF